MPEYITVFTCLSMSFFGYLRHCFVFNKIWGSSVLLKNNIINKIWQKFTPIYQVWAYKVVSGTAAVL